MNSKVVLVVEDEVALLSIYQKALELNGYEVLIATNGEAALKILNSDGARVDLMISDIVMGGMGGRELVWHLRQARSDIPVILASGYANQDGAFQMMDDDNLIFLPKPIDLQLLIDTVRRNVGDSAE